MAQDYTPRLGSRFVVASNGSSAIDMVILASAIVPPIAAVIICWLVWRWMKRESEAHGDERDH
jgi:hypothetical protein